MNKRKIILLLINIIILEAFVFANDYILISPLANNNVYLLNRDGDTIHKWTTDFSPGLSVYLMPNGNLLRCENVKSNSFKAGGAGGRISIYDKDSNLLWYYELNDKKHLSHHDVELMPNGNILIIVWEKKSLAEAIENGLNSQNFKEKEIWSDYIIEVDPTTNEIVWQWHVWDHLIQDYDNTKDNFGIIWENTDKININYFGSKDKVDWIHLNSIDYNQETDQILVSSHSFSEVWLIDHSEENSGIISRWGNPEAFDSSIERELYNQHDGKFLDNGNILIFNNGDRVKQPFSEVIELSNISTNPQIVWSYTDKKNFFASNISGAQRLDNGNTLICDGPSGKIFEVTLEKQVVWSYTSPFYSKTPNKSINEIFRAEIYDDSYSGIEALL